MDTKVQSLLNSLPDEKLHLALSLRDLIMSMDKDLKEYIKYGRITFKFSGTDIAFLCIKASNAHVELGFFEGASLLDPSNLLSGKASRVRRLAIHKPNEKTIQIQDWLKQLMLQKS
jgi:hypothetical protein